MHAIRTRTGLGLATSRGHKGVAAMAAAAGIGAGQMLGSVLHPETSDDFRRNLPPCWVGAVSVPMRVYHHCPSPSEKSGENSTLNSPSRPFASCTHLPL